MMTISDSNLMLGYDYGAWYDGGEKKPVCTDISTSTNSHTILCGMSGSGKSKSEEAIMARIAKSEGAIFFGDFKQDDTFKYLRGCPRYYPYYQTEEALNAVYNILHRRQSGEDKSRYPITLIWDEYMANVLALLGNDKKRAESIMRKVSEILMLGRSMAVRIIISCQRPDASAFPSGSRLNYGICIVLGASIRSIYEMLLPKEYIDAIGDRNFKAGEGVALLQGSDLRFIKMPLIKNEKQLQALCIDALTREIPEGVVGEADDPHGGIVLPDVHTHKHSLDDIRV
ncbi:hypothetical protein SAMN02910264_01602 [Ruminococcaceae bacterium YAD3003]|nr:hypothetical protein SAMN02910264_01602 [Ruminococcaceae bacterium YAD3003]